VTRRLSRVATTDIDVIELSVDEAVALRWERVEEAFEGESLRELYASLIDAICCLRETQRQGHRLRPLLIETPAAVRFVSAEPLLGPVDLLIAALNGTDSFADMAGIRWVIVGGESGHHARQCDVAWIRRVVNDCRRAKVPCFVKQLGARPYEEVRDDEGPREVAAWWNLDGWPEDRVLWDDAGECWLPRLRDLKGADPSEWPDDLRVRESPTGRTEDDRGGVHASEEGLI
jgi:hypothetical protein